MKINKILFFSVLTFLTAVPSSWAAYLSLVGTGNYQNVKTTTDSSTTKTVGKWGLGGGALMEFRISRVVGFELGALYAPRKHYADGVTNNFPYLEIPATLRFWIGRVISLNVGGYYAYGIGNVTDQAGNSGTFQSVNVKKADYGVLGGLSLNIPLSYAVSFLVDGRYHYGLANVLNVDIPGASTKWSGFQGLAGLRFFFR